MDENLPKEIKDRIIKFQRNEITEYFIYKELARIVKDNKNKEILEQISAEELSHYQTYRNITGVELRPSRIKILFYLLLSRLFGLTFSIKYMENAESVAQKTYSSLKEKVPLLEKIIEEENRHEQFLVNLIDEDLLKYVSSMVLGLNDALVELTGALVGFTLALQNTKLVAIVGLITGIAAAMSMSASEYLSTKQEDTEKNPLKASIYTGIAYIFTVIFLIIPYLLFENIFFCLSLVIVNALFIVFFFTFYISVAKGFSFKRKFFEMAGISLSIAAINFMIGLIIRKVFGIDV